MQDSDSHNLILKPNNVAMKISTLLVLLILISGNIFSQEKSKKQLKEEQKIEKQKQIEAMLYAKEFVFNPRTAMPQGYKTVNLTSGSYNIDFKPEFIKSYMPFYGRAYSGVGYGSDGGMKFEGKPEEFSVTKGKKNYTVLVVVKGDNDTYHISLSVSTSGSATLTIISNNRGSISYSGEISAIEKPENK